jgi:hypothetical protein
VISTTVLGSFIPFDSATPARLPMKGKAGDTSRDLPRVGRMVVRVRLPDATAADRLFEVGAMGEGGSALS